MVKEKNYILWQGLVGGIGGLVFFIIINLFSSKSLIDFFIPLGKYFVLFMFILVFGLLGLFVSFLNSLVKSGIVWKWALFGGGIGIISNFFLPSFLFEIKFFREYFFRPINYLDTLITGCKTECMYRMLFIYPLIFIILGIFLFTMITFIILKIKSGQK